MTTRLGLFLRSLLRRTTFQSGMILYSHVVPLQLLFQSAIQYAPTVYFQFQFVSGALNLCVPRAPSIFASHAF